MSLCSVQVLHTVTIPKSSLGGMTSMLPMPMFLHTDQTKSSRLLGMSAPFTAPEKASRNASLVELPSIFGRFGNIIFGGGSITIAVLHREIVCKRTWISEEVFALCYALSEGHRVRTCWHLRLVWADHSGGKDKEHFASVVWMRDEC